MTTKNNIFNVYRIDIGATDSAPTPTTTVYVMAESDDRMQSIVFGILNVTEPYRATVEDSRFFCYAIYSPLKVHKDGNGYWNNTYKRWEAEPSFYHCNMEQIVPLQYVVSGDVRYVVKPMNG